jgi:hypothetical protein
MYSDGKGDIRVVPNYGRLLPNRIALHIGEALYQLRAALDSCIYDAAILETRKNPPPDENRLEFPICDSAGDFDGKAFRLGPLAQKHRDFIESVQPYKAPEILKNIPPKTWLANINRNLGILNDWARKDRHRRLHIIGGWAAEVSPRLVYPHGVHVSSLEVVGSGFLEHEDKVATFRLDGFRPGMKIDCNLGLGVDIALDEPPPPCAGNDTLGNRLTAMEISVRLIVRYFENSFGNERVLPVGFVQENVGAPRDTVP